MKVNKLIVFSISFLFLISLVSAEFGYDSPDDLGFGYDTISEGEVLGGHLPSFFTPLNTSLFGNFSWNDGCFNGGVSIFGGSICAETLFVFNITALNVTEQNLTIIDDLILNGFTQGSTLFIGSSGEIAEDNSNFFWDDSNNRLGIGTATPSNPLVVQGNTNGDHFIDINNIGSGSAARAGFSVRVDGLSGVPAMTTQIFSNTHTFFSGIAELQAFNIGTAFNIGIGTASSTADVNFVTKDTTRLTIHSDGNVGIGTTSPQQLLEVNSSTSNEGRIRITETATAAGFTGLEFFGYNGVAATFGGGIFREQNTNDISIWTGSNVTDPIINIQDSSGDVTINAETFFVDGSNGRVGIGTTIPAEELSVVDGRMSVINTATTGFSVVEFGNPLDDLVGGFFLSSTAETGYAGVNSLNLVNIKNFPLGLGVDNSVDFFIESGGNIGIGTLDPDFLLHTEGDVDGNLYIRNYIQNTGTGGSAITFGTDSMAIHGGLFAHGSGISTFGGVDSFNLINFETGGDTTFGTNGAVDVTIKAGGNIGIGTITPANTLEVNGTLNISNDQLSRFTVDSDGHAEFTMEGSGGTTNPGEFEFRGGAAAANVVVIEAGGGSNTGDALTIYDVNPTLRFRITKMGVSSAAGYTYIGAGVNPTHTFNSVGGSGVPRVIGTISSTSTLNGELEFARIEFRAVNSVSGSSRQGDILFYTQNQVGGAGFTEKMRIRATGNVGINTTTPSHTLNVLGDINISNNSLLDIFSLDFTNGDQILGNSSLIISTGDNKVPRILIGASTELINSHIINLTASQDNLSTVLLGNVDNFDDINDFSRYRETNLNNGSFAVAGFQSQNNLNHTMNIGITSSNFSIGGMFLPNEGVTFSLAPNGTSFANFLFQGFDWFTNRADSVVSFDFVKIASLSPQGNFNISGNLNVSGNMLGNDIYGYAKMKNISGVVIDLISVGVFENITGINNGSKLNGISYDGDHAFTIDVAGTYEVSASVSFAGASATDYSFDIFVNGIGQDIFAMRDISNPNAIGSISLGPYAITVSQGDFVTLGISDGAVPTDPTIISAQFGLRRIGD